MNSYSDKTSELESQSVSSSESQKKSAETAAIGFVDNRPEALAQRELQEMINGQSKDAKLDSGLDTVGGSPKSAGNANWEKLKSKISLSSDLFKMSGEIAAGKTVLNKDGASLARRMDKKEQIASPELLFSPAEVKAHLGKFSSGAHAFISPEKNKNIKGDWGWGLDKNFVGTLKEADALVEKAQKEKGIFTLEEELGIPHLKSWSWANKEKNPEHAMWRYKIPKPENYNLAMPSGRESGAYKEEWIAGGKALGGADEAVIDKIPRIRLLLEIAKGEIITEEVKFPTTEDYFEEYIV
jgi:hypothetical protein